MNNSSNNTEKELGQHIREMEATIVKLSQSIAQLSSAKKRTQDSYSYHISEITRWEKRAWLALSAKDEYLAKEALLRKQYSQETVAKLKTQIELDRSTVIIADLQQKSTALKMKVADYKMIQVKLNATKVQRQLRESIGGIDTSIAMGAFERMEDKVMQLEEEESQSVMELGGMSLEEQFAQLEASSSVEDELAEMKSQLINGSANSIKSSTDTSTDSAIDDELEELRAQLNQ